MPIEERSPDELTSLSDGRGDGARNRFAGGKPGVRRHHPPRGW
ncbi:MAG: hypothetical protein WDN44_01345 [Sphingomonas sp.]